MILSRLTLLYILIGLAFKSSLAQESNAAVSQNASLEHTIYLIGDAGGLDNHDIKTNVVFELAKTSLKQERGYTDLIFLGDNIYPKGMQAITDPDFARQKDIIDAHIDLAHYTNGKTYIIPGNHDWNDAKAKGADINNNQYQYIKENSENIALKYLPKSSCGDPKVVKINKDLIYLFIDSQWWLQDWEKEDNINQGCKIKSRLEFLEELEQIVTKHKNDRILFFLHHPLKSDGHHGARFGLHTHLLPLPVLGSLMPLARKMGIARQDNTHKDYELLHQSLLDAISTAGANNVYFISGHDHNLQYFFDEQLFSKSKKRYIVSGAGYKRGYVSHQGEAIFASDLRGYQILRMYSDGSVRLTAIGVDPNTNQETIIFNEQIEDPLIDKLKPLEKEETFPPLSKQETIIPNSNLAGGPIHNLFFGKQYRNLWQLPIRVPVANLDSLLGGLTPIKLGGGANSNSLRLADTLGREYILRSVKKDYRKLIPEAYKKVVWIDFYADQNASAIPYGALMLKKMSEAIEVFHTNASLYHLPHQSRLYQYNDKLTEGLFILENRPDGKLWSDNPNFGNSSKIIGTNDLFEKLANKKTHFVDQSWVLKSRLFDMIIHDWDRHEDQWRWASYKDQDQTIYRPIPRDRDWAFYKSEGLLYAISNQLYLKNFKSFKKELKDVKNFNTSATHFDRFYLNQLSWNDWKKQIDYIQENLTEEVILSALKDLPQESQSAIEKELLPKLRHRLHSLEEYAEKYYHILSEKVNIVGSHNKDFFEVEVLENDEVKIIHYVKKDDQKLTRFNRSFDPKQTKEIYLFGRAGKDQLTINGDLPIKIYFVGGTDRDEIKTKQKQDNLIVYDEIEGIKSADMENFKHFLSADIDKNKYDYHHFKYDAYFPTFTVSSTIDDGILVGAGISKTVHGFKQFPYLRKHELQISFAPFVRTALRVNYQGSYKLSRKHDWLLEPLLYWHVPEYINYFGLDNELSSFPEDNNLNWVRMRSYRVYTPVSRNYVQSVDGNRNLKFSVGPYLQGNYIARQEGRVIDFYDPLPQETIENWLHFAGIESKIEMFALDNRIYPKNGFKLSASINHSRQIAEGDSQFTNLESSLSAYFTPFTKWPLVIASNSYYIHNFGDPLWFQLPSVGVNNQLRTYRNDRFRGQQIVGQQIELRKELFTWNNRILPFTLGINTGIDYSYINTENNPRNFQYGYVNGLSFNILDYFLINTNLGYAPEDDRFLFSLTTNMSF